MLAALGGLFILLLCIDMGIKQYVEDTFRTDEERDTKIDFLVLRKAYNRGFLLNALDKYPAVIRRSSMILGVGIAIYDLWLFLCKGRWIGKLGAVFLSAGAASNIYDRLARGKVVDYIGFKSKRKFVSKVTANLADLYVIIGMAVITAAGRRKK